MAKAYMGQGDYDNAKVKLTETLAMDPSNKVRFAILFLLVQETLM